MKKLLLIFVLIILLVGCKQQSQEGQIKETCMSVITSLKANNFEGFKSFIGVPLSVIGKNDEMLKSDFNKIRGFIKSNNAGADFPVNITSQYDGVGRLKVIIPLEYKTINHKDITTLNLYFGPPNIVPLSKISNYEILVPGRDLLQYYNGK